MKTLRETIIAACPEILDLKFGCRVTPKYLDASTHTIIKKFPETPDGSQVYKMDDGSNIIKSDLKQILGCPIELYHVLRAMPIETIEVDKLSPETIRITPKGIAASRVKGYGYWNLREPLERQDPSTIAFLEKLLVTE